MGGPTKLPPHFSPVVPLVEAVTPVPDVRPAVVSTPAVSVISTPVVISTSVADDFSPGTFGQASRHEHASSNA